MYLCTYVVKKYYSVQEYYGNEDKEKIKQLENTVMTQTVNHQKEIEKIKKDTTVSYNMC